MPNKYTPIFHVSSKAYGSEADGVATALAARFSTFRFGVSGEGSPRTKENAPVHEFLAKSYPPSSSPVDATAPTQKAPDTAPTSTG